MDIADSNTHSPSLLFVSAIDEMKHYLDSSRQNIIITSPYLTSDTAERIVTACDPESTIILTTFRAETFGTGGSSLDCIRTLLQSGYNMRYLNDLHAKVLLTEEACFVGSQNLTAGGTANKEATAKITDRDLLTFAKDSIQVWVEKSQPITVEMVSEMASLIEEITSSASHLKSEAAKIDDIVERKQRERDEQHERDVAQLSRALLLKSIERSYSGLQAKASSLNSSPAVHLKHQFIRGPTVDHDTLLASPGINLTHWVLDSGTYELRKRNRYLLIVPQIGRLGWPALNATRLTYFGTELEPADAYVRLGGHLWVLERVRFNEDLSTLSSWNVRFKISRGLAEHELLMKFSLSDLELFEVEGSGKTNRIDELREDLDGERSQLRKLFRETLLQPFRYRKNAWGVSVESFCKGLSSPYYLTLKTYNRFQFFCLEAYDVR